MVDLARQAKKSKMSYTEMCQMFNLPARYSLSQYDELIQHMWRTQISQDGKQEVSETKFLKFLRENNILNERKQLDEMLR